MNENNEETTIEITKDELSLLIQSLEDELAIQIQKFRKLNAKKFGVQASIGAYKKQIVEYRKAMQSNR